MANDLRIVDAPEIPSEEFTSEVKIPTGGKGNYSVTAEQISEFVKVNKDLTDKDYVDTSSNGVKQLLENHKNDKANPHVVTKAQIGLGNVNNTADLDKPVSNATNAAIVTATNTLKESLGTASEYDVEDLPVTQKQREEFVGKVKLIEDLITIENPKDGQVVFVKSIEKNYTYTPETSEVENGVTVVSKWVMEVPELYYASWFATPELGDVSAQLKTGYEYATEKKRTFVIDAKYNARSILPIEGSPLYSAINVLSNSHLYFLPSGSVQLITDNSANSNIICAKDVDNYIITRPKLTGDRLTNTANEGSMEWGYGLTIYPSSNGYIFEPEISNCMGDGLYVGKSWAYPNDAVPTNITVIRPKVDRVRRNGISLTSGKNVFIDSPIVSNVTTIDGIAPTEPASGLDVEPESAPDFAIAHLENCTIHNPTFINCDKAINFWNQATDSFMDVRITGETNIYNNVSTHTGLWMRNERKNAPKSRLYIEKVIFNSKLDQPILAFIFEQNNVSVEIGEVLNNTSSNLDFVYAPVDGAQKFGNFKIGKLRAVDQNFGFTVVYNSYNKGCFTALRIEDVDCKLGSFNLNANTMMNKSERYFVNKLSYVFDNTNTNLLVSSRFQFESYGVLNPRLAVTTDQSLVKVSLSPASPNNNPLIVSGLNIPYEGTRYTTIRLQQGAETVFRNVSGVTEVIEKSSNAEIIIPITTP